MIDQCNILLNRPFEFTIDYEYETVRWWLYVNSKPVIYFDDVMYVWSRAMAIIILIANKTWDDLSKWFNHMELINKTP